MKVKVSLLCGPGIFKLKMGMPVHQFITILEEQMQIDDEDPAGDHEEHDDEGQGAGDFSGVKVALMEGDYGANCSIGDLVPWSVTTNNQSLHNTTE